MKLVINACSFLFSMIPRFYDTPGQDRVDFAMFSCPKLLLCPHSQIGRRNTIPVTFDVLFPHMSTKSSSSLSFPMPHMHIVHRPPIVYFTHV